jgi:hypothetical protein
MHRNDPEYMEARTRTEQLLQQICHFRGVQESHVLKIQNKINDVEWKMVHYYLDSAAAIRREQAGMIDYDPKPEWEVDEDEWDFKKFGTQNDSRTYFFS